MRWINRDIRARTTSTLHNVNWPEEQVEVSLNVLMDVFSANLTVVVSPLIASKIIKNGGCSVAIRLALPTEDDE